MVIGRVKLLALLFPIWTWQLFNVVSVDWYGCNKRESIYWLAHIKTIPVHSTSQHNIPQLRYLNNDSLLESLEVSNLGLSNSLKASNTRSRNQFTIEFSPHNISFCHSRSSHFLYLCTQLPASRFVGQQIYLERTLYCVCQIMGKSHLYKKDNTPLYFQGNPGKVIKSGLVELRFLKREINWDFLIFSFFMYW